MQLWCFIIKFELHCEVLQVCYSWTEFAYSRLAQQSALVRRVPFIQTPTGSAFYEKFFILCIRSSESWLITVLGIEDILVF